MIYQLAGLVTILLLFSGCAFEHLSPSPETLAHVALAPPQRYDGWEVAAPETVGLDVNHLGRLYEKASKLTYLHSFLVVRHGKLVAEAYFQGHDWTQTANLKSVSKSVLSALVGIALEKGYVPHLDTPLADLIPDYFSKIQDPGKRRITLRHLLTMQSGLKSTSGGYYRHWKKSPDWIRYALNSPMLNTPGSRFRYSTSNSHLLSFALSQAAGIDALTLAQQYLFQPLNIRFERWEVDPQQYYQGGNNMYLTPREMARFGLLYLNLGRYQGQQIVSAEWIHQSTAVQVTGRHRYHYGYHWWVGKLGGVPSFFAKGYGGQYIVVLPSLNIVVVTTANPSVQRSLARSNRDAIFALVRSYLNGALTRP